MFSIADRDLELAHYDFLVLGSSVIYYRLSIRRRLRRHVDSILTKPTLLFTVSGAPAGAKLDAWIAKSLPGRVISHVDHVALQGRQRPEELTRFDRTMLKIGALFNRDAVARREELQGFDYMDRSTIAPIVEWIGELQTSTNPTRAGASGATRRETDTEAT